MAAKWWSQDSSPVCLESTPFPTEPALLLFSGKNHRISALPHKPTVQFPAPLQCRDVQLGPTLPSDRASGHAWASLFQGPLEGLASSGISLRISVPPEIGFEKGFPPCGAGIERDGLKPPLVESTQVADAPTVDVASPLPWPGAPQIFFLSTNIA